TPRRLRQAVHALRRRRQPAPHVPLQRGHVRADRVRAAGGPGHPHRRPLPVRGLRRDLEPAVRRPPRRPLGLLRLTPRAGRRYSEPFVDGTAPPSIRTASRRQRATPLKLASMTWWVLRPARLVTWRVIAADVANDCQKCSAISGLKGGSPSGR